MNGIPGKSSECPRIHNIYNPVDEPGVEVNVSAVVGKNGSGKSTLIEFLIRIINNISI